MGSQSQEKSINRHCQNNSFFSLSQILLFHNCYFLLTYYISTQAYSLLWVFIFSCEGSHICIKELHMLFSCSSVFTSAPARVSSRMKEYLTSFYSIPLQMMFYFTETELVSMPLLMNIYLGFLCFCKQRSYEHCYACVLIHMCNHLGELLHCREIYLQRH